MKEMLSVITRKGQITVPAEIRRALDLHEGDKVALTMENDRVSLRRVGSVVARTAGILKGEEPPLRPNELRAVAEQAIADETVERLPRKNA